MKRTSKKQTGKPTYQAVPSNVECAKLFMASLPAVLEGGNNCRGEFMQVAFMLLSNYPTFSVNDCLTLAKYKDLPTPEIAKLFQLWTKKLVGLGRLKQIVGCYDEPVYAVV
jgi:hypothetical protein